MITHLLTEDTLRFNNEAKTAMIYFIQHNFYPLSPQTTFRILPFQSALANDFLAHSYKQIFLLDSVSSKIALFFTQNSPDECPILLYVLLLLL